METNELFAHAFLKEKDAHEGFFQTISMQDVEGFNPKKKKKNKTNYLNKTVKLISNDVYGDHMYAKILFISDSKKEIEDYCIKSSRGEKRKKVPTMRFSGVEPISPIMNKTKKKKKTHQTKENDEDISKKIQKYNEDYQDLENLNDSNNEKKNISSESEDSDDSFIRSLKNREEIDAESVRQSKKQLKHQRELIDNQKRENNAKIIKDYKDSEYESLNRSDNSTEYSTPTHQRQSDDLVKEVENLKKRNRQLLTEISNIKSEKKSDTNSLRSHVFNIQETEEEPDLITLNKKVKCNSKSYKDAFRAGSCQRFFTLINTGIYGTDDLATRTVRATKKNSYVLSPVKQEVVNDEFLKYLQIHEYTAAQINLEMTKCEKYHRNSITAAAKVIQRNADAPDK